MRHGPGVALVLAALVCLGGLAACATDDPPVKVEPIWPSDFETAWPEVRDCRLSPAEHDGFYIRVFANPEAADAYVKGFYPFAEGTLLVKGEYDEEACATLKRVSAMRKLAKGAAPALGDWQWQRTDAAGQVLDKMPAKSCAGCHKPCAAHDYACTDP